MSPYIYSSIRKSWQQYFRNLSWIPPPTHLHWDRYFEPPSFPWLTEIASNWFLSSTLGPLMSLLHTLSKMTVVKSKSDRLLPLNKIVQRFCIMHRVKEKIKYRFFLTKSCIKKHRNISLIPSLPSLTLTAPAFLLLARHVKNLQTSVLCKYEKYRRRNKNDKAEMIQRFLFTATELMMMAFIWMVRRQFLLKFTLGRKFKHNPN